MCKQQEQESQHQMMKAMSLQQQQMNTACLNVVEKLLNNKVISYQSIFIQNMLLLTWKI